MNKPAYFFDVNYMGSDVVIDNSSVRGLDIRQTLGQLCSLNNRYCMKAIVDINVGQTIEVCPFEVLHGLKLSREPSEAIPQMEHMFILEDYSQFTRDNGPRLIVSGGNGPFYRHSYEPNGYIVYDHISKVVYIKAMKQIKSGDEITIYRYGSFQILHNNTQIQKFYQERQKELQEKNVDTSGFRSMSEGEIKNIETVEVKTEE
jgi:hypothetical protein